MNKLHNIGILALAMLGITACSPDKDPVLQEPQGLELNVPTFATEEYVLTSTGVSELTCTPPVYGVNIATQYTLQASLKENFGEGEAAPAEGEATLVEEILLLNPHSSTLEYNQKDLAIAICHLRGIFEAKDYTDEGPIAVYFRVIAGVNNQAPTLTTSNVVKLDKVVSYNAIEKKVLYTPGNANGWSQANSGKLAEYEEGKYRGFSYLKDGFKFTPAPNWDKGDWGIPKGDTEGGKLASSNTDNIPVPEEGLYWIEANINEEGEGALTYKLTLINTVGIIGDGGKWGDTDDVEMTSDDYLIWTVKHTFEGPEFKFRFNKGWDINLGGSIDDLTLSGGNLPITAGEHTVILNLTGPTYFVTID